MRGETYFWTLGSTSAGKRVLLGPYLTEEEATQSGQRLDRFEVLPLQTRSIQAATKMVKAMLFKKASTSPDVALERTLHTQGFDRHVERVEEKKQALSLGAIAGFFLGKRVNPEEINLDDF